VSWTFFLFSGMRTAGPWSNRDGASEHNTGELLPLTVILLTGIARCDSPSVALRQRRSMTGVGRGSFWRSYPKTI